MGGLRPPAGLLSGYLFVLYRSHFPMICFSDTSKSTRTAVACFLQPALVLGGAPMKDCFVDTT